MDEPTYVDVGDEFGDEDDSWRYPDDLTNQNTIKTVFAICGGRKYFATPKEARKWRRIDGQFTRGVIGTAWLEHCIEWAKKKNFRATVIKVDALGSYILNKAKMQDFLTKELDLTPKEDEEWRWK